MTLVNLKHPIRAHGEERRSIDLREPTGADIKACGGTPLGYVSGTDGKNISVVRPEVISAYAVRLGNIPPSAVDQLCPADWVRVENAIALFFRDEEEPETEMEASSTDSITSPGSGNGQILNPSSPLHSVS